MSQLAEDVYSDPDFYFGVEERVDEIIENSLKPITVDVDLEGRYPKEVLKSLGQSGAFMQHLSSIREDGFCDMGEAIKLMSKVSHECLSTGFSVWCQDACAWYIEVGSNNYLKENMLPKISSGEILAGTGMSNTMKAYADIEDLRLSGEKVDGGYIVNGSLPWVSNLGEDHMFGTLFAIDGDKDKPVMALVDCSSKGFELRLSAHFVALEGTRTFACIFNDVFIPDEMIIDHDGKSFMKKARFGMIMLQAGMAAGNIQACIDICKDNEARLGHVNAYLDDRPEELQEELDDLLDACIALAEDPYDTSDDHFKDVLQLRLTAGELTLRASQSAMLHAGASGYLIKAKAQRKLRESYFVAIVTPAIKHLRKQLAEMA